MVLRTGIVAVCRTMIVSSFFMIGMTIAEVDGSTEENHAEAGERVLKVRIPMRDGVELSATAFLPGQEGKFPVVLQRTPYQMENWVSGHEKWTHHGYVYVVQDVRGRFESKGTFYPFFQESNDGYDTLAWIHKQPWCNGEVGMFGPSYNAIVQFAAIRGGGAPLVKSLIPTFTSGDLWVRGFYSGGVYSMFLAVQWSCVTNGRVDHSVAFRGLDHNSFYRQLPLLTLAQSAGCGEAQQFSDLVTHYTYDDYWKASSIRQEYALYDMPVLLIGGWYDYYPQEMLNIYQGIVDNAPSPEIARSHKIIIGPWAHHGGLTPEDENFSVIDFGPESSFDSLGLYRSWFDRTLKGIGPHPTQDAPIRIFVMGANKWRDEHQWPLARTQYVDYYLHSRGKANTLDGDGMLNLEPPNVEPADTYTYNPEDPVSSNGGNHSIIPPIKDVVWPGPADQRSIEEREDVLTYTSQPLEKDTEVTGPVVLKLYAASSAPDTDFVGRLNDVYPDGRAINITEGVIRARFRKREYWEKPKLIEPGVIYEYTIELQATSNVFKKGHRLRLDITSSNFPLWDRNLNTGHLPWLDTEIKKAEQSISHTGEYASRLILPIIP